MIQARSENASETAYLISTRNGPSAWLYSPSAPKILKQNDFDKLQSIMEEFTRSDAEFREFTKTLLDLNELKNFGKK